MLRLAHPDAVVAGSLEGRGLLGRRGQVLGQAGVDLHATSQSLRISSVCSPGRGGGPPSSAGVRLNRGAGAGCTTPSRSTNTPRAVLYRCRVASVSDST